jgi:hypothetical protein
MVLTLLAAVTGIALLIGSATANSATYDEVAYLRVAAHWWRTGDAAEITRMGSPLLFWKLQQAPVLWLLDQTGRGSWIDDPAGHEGQLLPLVRMGAVWIWILGLGLTAAWSYSFHGPRAMAFAAWLFALSPNLIAHGALATMELPLVAASTAMFWFFWLFLSGGRLRWLWASACAAGIAFSCKFTAILFPPILFAVWCVARISDGERSVVAITQKLAPRMLAFAAVMVCANLAVTGFARIEPSQQTGRHPSLARFEGTLAGRVLSRIYETPLPQDWVAFATQMRHQVSGGPSYLFGERRTRGWSYYYLIALAVKVPLGVWLLISARIAVGRVAEKREALIPLVFVMFLTLTAIGSSRNYGVRYLLPLAPLAIVWVSALVKKGGPRWCHYAALSGLAGVAAAALASHPYELTYFNAIAGGPSGGRRILADSNLDWGQGLYSLARLQDERPELKDVTLYYFGDSDPRRYRVAGRFVVVSAVEDYSQLPMLDRVETPYLAVSASLQWGPWGPRGFFEQLKRLEPVCLTGDTTIAIYRTADLRAILAVRQ